MAKVEISASILAADLTKLAREIDEAGAAGVDRFHTDVMDGRFVPNITFGPLMVEAVRRCTRATVEAHLMVVEPDRYVPDFAKAGADVILVHQEACAHLGGTLEHIHRLGKRAGVVLNPATAVETIADVLPEIEQVLIMSVNPGFGGQQFIDGTLAKIARLHELIARRNPACAIEVDGGIGPGNAAAVVGAGADVLAVGVSLFRAPDGIATAVARLRQSAAAG
jgi:ribulose-phosphate 3-epimerase